MVVVTLISHAIDTPSRSKTRSTLPAPSKIRFSILVNSMEQSEQPIGEKQPIHRTRERVPRSSFDNELLADRMANWFPNQTNEQLLKAIVALSESDFWKLHADVYKLNTSVNLEFGSKTCAEHGWFPDLEFPAVSIGQLGERIKAGGAEDTDQYFEEYYDRRRIEIEKELVADFPHRTRLLRMFFRLHDDGLYDASIPLGLAQADGIAHEVFDGQLYRVKRGSSRLRSTIDKKKVDWIWEALAAPLRAALPLAVPVRPSNKMFNRNTILHGTNLEYGTKRNSLRTLSLLSYLRGMATYEKMALNRATIV